MKPIKILSSLACPLALENVDTDQLIPARFMKEPRNVGYGNFLLHDLRFGDSESQKGFILNDEAASSSQIMVARRNFGAGSSREAAVYALVDFGFRCVIAPSFGDIFTSNSVNNGLLPALVSEKDCESLLSAMDGKFRQVSVDLQDQSITLDDIKIAFDINPTWKLKLLNGWDDIDLTMAETPKIKRFREDYLNQYPWLG